MTALNKIIRAADAFPDRIAYQAGNDRISYRSLVDRAEHYADLLRRQGNTPVVLYGPKTVDTLTAIVACLISRRPYVPVGGFTPLSRLRRIIALTGASLVLTDLSPEAEGADVCPLSGLERFAGLREQESSDQTAYIIFTSGSTGEPKGVPIPYANLDHFSAWISGLFPLREYHSVNVLNQADFSFDLSVADCYYALCNGHTLVCGAPSDDLPAVFHTMSRIDVAVITPTFLRLCLLNRDFRAENFPRLRCVYCCGETLESVLATKLFAAFPDVVLLNAYGPTEATSAVSAVRITPEMATTLSPLPVGEKGSCAVEIVTVEDEIVLKGKSVFRGYLNGPQGGCYTENGVHCYRTGDLGYWKDGLLYCKGRADSQVKFKGYRIELSEIETHLGRIEGVTDCAVVAKKGPNGAVMMLNACYSGAVAEKTVRSVLQKELPAYMIPGRIRRLERLPVNVNGKIDRKALRE